MPRAAATGLGLLGIGALAGSVASTALGADAATTSTTTAPSSSGTSATAPVNSSTAGGSASTPSTGGAFHLPLSGTVTAVGSSDVTIKTASGTTTYAVTSSSDIDKDGEAALSNLAVGDAVTFSTVTTNGTPAIDKLHAGNEQLDMPQGGGPGGQSGNSGPASSSGSGATA